MGGLTSRSSACELVVKAIEKLAVDEGVRSDMAAKFQVIRFDCLPNGVPKEQKALCIDAGTLVVTGAFLAGGAGAFTSKEILEFFESQCGGFRMLFLRRFGCEPQYASLLVPTPISLPP